ncbi:MAG: T9SS type A sorting domain-containing protein [Paludibacter sp.]
MKITRIIFLLLLQSAICFAQSPVIKVDLNIGSRQASEVNDPNFMAWPISTVASTTDTIQGVVITFTGLTESLAASTLTSSWYKVGVQAPNYARLSCDGIVATVLEMRIHGLPAGTHTLLTYHNTMDGPTAYVYNPIRIYLNDKVVVDSLMPTNREVVLSNVPISYLTFTVIANEDVIVRFAPRPTSTSTFNKVTLNGFEINTPNSMHQAYLPFPSDRDEHIDGDAGSVKMKWNKATTAVSHDLYFGTDSTTVANANHLSTCFKGNKTDSTYVVSEMYDMNKYYWRVDEITANDAVTKGNTWYFRTRKLAFNGAEGFGRYSIGGRGGKVVEVTNLNDDGPGSLREAVTKNVGPRTVVFAVSGIITLSSRLAMSQSYVTVAGQTAPGKGICIRQAPFGLSGGNDVIIQNVRVRLGAGTTYDGMGMAGANFSILDHCSISWTIDESFSSRSGKNITLQRTLISEALNAANHQNYPAGTEHGYAASIGGDVGSFHHNLLAHCYGRNWSLAGGLDGSGVYIGRLDIRNNVVYNWGARTTDGGANQVNFVNNYYKPGASTTMHYALNAQHEAVGTGTQQYFFDGNVMPGYFDESTQTKGREATGVAVTYDTFVSSPFFESYVTTQTAGDAFKNVLSDVGCIQPVFDDHDKRIINETLNGTYSCVGSVTGKKGLPDSQVDVGGWENYPIETRAANFDTDHDGLPDWWENLQGTNLNSPVGDFTDANADADHDGYTNLEDYLQWMMNPHYNATISNTLDIDLGQYSLGYTTSPAFVISGLSNCSVSMVSGTKTARFSSTKKGLAKFNFTVTDAAGSSMTRMINVNVGEATTGINTLNQNDDISIYPNPAQNSLFISNLNNLIGSNRISISNSIGQKVLEYNSKHATSETSLSIDISALQSGIYFITIGHNKAAKQFIKY